MPTSKSKYPINDRIIEKMAEAGLDEMALAAASGLPKATIYRIAKKEVKPNRGTVEVLARALKANFSYLFTGVHREPEVTQNVTTETNPYRDYALKRLEDEVDTWKQKYEQVWDRFTNLLERVPLGKFNPDSDTAYRAVGT